LIDMASLRAKLTLARAPLGQGTQHGMQHTGEHFPESNGRHNYFSKREIIKPVLDVGEFCSPWVIISVALMMMADVLRRSCPKFQLIVSNRRLYLSTYDDCLVVSERGRFVIVERAMSVGKVKGGGFMVVEPKA
jgi:hypothetical protein